MTEGYKNLGFMGGIAVPAVIRYGYGFIQGADAVDYKLISICHKGDVVVSQDYGVAMALGKGLTRFGEPWL